MNKYFLLILFLTITLGGCATTKRSPLQEETTQESREAIESVVEALAGQELNDKDIRQLTNQLRKDKDAQTAIEAITETMDPTAVKVKYSPATGKRYSASVEYCPETGVKLLPVE